jgi:hypothetical protein
MKDTRGSIVRFDTRAGTAGAAAEIARVAVGSALTVLFASIDHDLAELGRALAARGVIRMVGAATGTALTAHPAVDEVTFTGSTEVGRLVEHEERHGRTRRLIAGDRARRCRSRHRDCRGRERNLLQPRRGLLGRFAALCCEAAFRPRRRGRR